MATNDIEISMRKSLPVAASIWVDAARSKAKTKKIRAGFEIGQVVENGRQYSIEIRNMAPEAAAYEFGSGLFSTKQAPRKILIRPKNGVVLAFNMPEALNIQYDKVRPGPGGEVFLPQVLHPGVKPEPFMQPALEEVRGQMVKVIGKTFAVEVVHKSIREVWANAQRK